MIIALSFHDGDERLAVRVLEWARRLDEEVSRRGLLVFPHGCDPTRVQEIAEQYFAGGVELVRYDKPMQGAWPQGKNAAFQEAARWMADKHADKNWLWWEPDAIPLRKGWLDEIETEHKSLGSRVSGYVFGSGWVDGVAVYPGRFLELSVNAMLCRAAPFDQVAGRDLLPVAARNKRFQVVWDVNGVAPTFKSRAETKRVLEKDAAIFHRCKDGSLIEILSQGTLTRVCDAVKDALAGGKKRERSEAPCVVMLGRYGDIINILPVVRHLNETGKRPAVMVAEKFADILQGVGYADAHVWKGDFTDVQNAAREAEAAYGRVLVGQVNGRNFDVNTECDSFSAESWRQMGYLDKWNQLPLVFDKRFQRRELRLWQELKKEPGKKTLLVNFSGKSSPFQHADRVLADILGRWRERFEVVDLGKVKAQRLYDLLGVMDRADLMVTIDTATTHLALASSIPVINLVADTPTMWHGARPRGHSVLAIRYREVMARLEEIHDAIGRVSSVPSTPLMVHVYSDYEEMSPDTARRVNFARNTWYSQYRKGRWTAFPVKNGDLPRVFEDQGRKLPYVRDLLDAGADSGEVLVLTNTDTCFAESATLRIADQLRHTKACYSFRRDFKQLTKPLADADVARGQYYPGSDLFVMKTEWWKANRERMPDMVIGTEAWDLVLRTLIDETHAGAVCRFDDVIYHERHASVWEAPQNRGALPSQTHNLNLARAFLKQRGIEPRKHGIKG